MSIDGKTAGEEETMIGAIMSDCGMEVPRIDGFAEWTGFTVTVKNEKSPFSTLSPSEIDRERCEDSGIGSNVG